MRFEVPRESDFIPVTTYIVSEDQQSIDYKVNLLLEYPLYYYLHQDRDKVIKKLAIAFIIKVLQDEVKCHQGE